MASSTQDSFDTIDWYRLLWVGGLVEGSKNEMVFRLRNGEHGMSNYSKFTIVINAHVTSRLILIVLFRKNYIM